MPSKSKNEVKVGQRIEALVKHVTSDAAAKRFYGAEWDKQRCPGIVTRVEKVLTNPSGKVKQTMVTATYSLPDGRQKSLNLNKRSIYIVTDESPPANPPNTTTTATTTNALLPPPNLSTTTTTTTNANMATTTTTAAAAAAAALPPPPANASTTTAATAALPPPPANASTTGPVYNSGRHIALIGFNYSRPTSAQRSDTASVLHEVLHLVSGWFYVEHRRMRALDTARGSLERGETSD